MDSSASKSTWTIEERSEARHEYVGGMLYAMAGSTDRHNRIAFNTSRKLADACDGGPCRVYISDMRVQIGTVYYYPDVMVACESPDTDNPTCRTNPCLVVEVLSAYSESIDQREKRLAFRGIPTVQTYLIVHQDMRRVERHYRVDDWRRADHVRDGYIPVPCPELRLTLEDMYRGL
ncbi:Uma2 family endonuclease [soil metagenome]